MNETQKPRFCVLGAGHGGMAMAGHLGLMGYEVKLYNRTEDKIESVQYRGGVDLEGEVKGFGPIRLATSNIEEALKETDVLMVVVPANAHSSVAETCAPFLKDGQIIILNPGRTGGALEFRSILKEKDVKADVLISETQTFIYAARLTNPGQVHIFRIKNSVPLAALPAHRTPEVLQVIKQVYPQFVPGDNVLKTSLDNIGAVFHPALAILNAGWIEDPEDFEFYFQGASISTCLVLEALDKERVAVAAALGIRANTAREWLYLAYDAVGKNLYEAMHANEGYKGIKAPDTINHRYISEDVPMSLVPIASLGDMLGVPTPTTKAIIHLANIMHNRDYYQTGRTVEKLGLAGMSVKDIRFMIVGADASSK